MNHRVHFRDRGCLRTLRLYAYATVVENDAQDDADHDSNDRYHNRRLSQ